ncbi:voltage-gated chloride channel protein, partial [bacterium]
MRPILYAVPIGIAAGGASAFFLVLLERASAFFEQDPRLLFLLPVFAAFTAWLYLKFGGAAGKGTDLVLDRAAEPGPDIPLAMAPLVLVGTVLTHLGGGSAGREGTAVQMGGSLADAFGRDLSREERCQTIVAGIAGGFGAVFGTPLAGAAFALEAPRPLPTKGLWYGPLWRGPLLPALLAAWIAHLTCLNLGVTHTDYRSLIGERILFSLPTLLLAIGVGIAAGGASRAFVLSIYGAKRLYGKVADPIVRAAVGGIAVVAVTLVLGTRAYNGLSIP